MPEHPPLDKTVLIGFESNDRNFPILAVQKDPRSGGYELPNFGADTGLSTEAIAAYPANKFTRAVNITEQRVQWLYEILPGPAITTTRLDEDGATVTVTNQRMVFASIATSEVLATGTWTRKWKGEGDAMSAIQITETRAIPGNILTGHKVDDRTGIKVIWTKQLVAAGTSGGKVGGAVLSLSIIDAGSGFTTNPTLSFGGDGSGATGTATITLPTSGSLGTVTLTARGAGYTSVPTATASGGGGSGATFTVLLRGIRLASLTLTNPGSGFTSPPNLVITDSGTGTGATGTLTLTPALIASAAVASGGSGYIAAPVVTVRDSGGSPETIAATLTGTGVASVAVTAGGSGYTTATVGFTGGGGSGATATATLLAGAVTSIAVTAAGTGYTSAPTVTITGDGTLATATSTLVPTSVASISTAAAVATYTAPIIAIAAPTAGTVATANALLTPTTIASVTLTGTGTRYQGPTATVVGGGGSNGAVIANLLPTVVKSISILTAGSGYSSPTLAFSGGGGAGAVATLALATGTITSVAVTAAGSNYTYAPVTVTGGGGTGADIRAVISGVVFTDVEPLTIVVSMKKTQYVDLTTLPPEKRYPKSVSYSFPDTSIASLVQISSGDDVDIAMEELTIKGYSGPTAGYMLVTYMTESQLSAYIAPNPTVVNEVSQTLVELTVTGEGRPKAWTFHPPPYTDGIVGTTVYVGMTLQQLMLDIWEVERNYAVNPDP